MMLDQVEVEVLAQVQKEQKPLFPLWLVDTTRYRGFVTQVPMAHNYYTWEPHDRQHRLHAWPLNNIPSVQGERDFDKEKYREIRIDVKKTPLMEPEKAHQDLGEAIYFFRLCSYACKGN